MCVHDMFILHTYIHMCVDHRLQSAFSCGCVRFINKPSVASATDKHVHKALIVIVMLAFLRWALKPSGWLYQHGAELGVQTETDTPRSLDVADPCGCTCRQTHGRQICIDHNYSSIDNSNEQTRAYAFTKIDSKATTPSVHKSMT